MDSPASRSSVRRCCICVLVPLACLMLLLGACVQTGRGLERGDRLASPDQQRRVRAPGASGVMAGGAEADDPHIRQRSGPRDARCGVGTSIVRGARSTVILTAPGAEPRVVFQLLAPEQVWRP